MKIKKWKSKNENQKMKIKNVNQKIYIKKWNLKMKKYYNKDLMIKWYKNKRIDFDFQMPQAL